MQNKRNQGIELLRIIATFMVCAVHVLGKGGILTGVDTFSPQGWTSWLITAFFACAVNCYGLISGYVGWNTKFRYSRLAYLWVTCVFVGLVITVGFAVWQPETVKLTHWIKAIFPISTRQFWYISAYAGVLILMPILNQALRNLSRKQVKAILLALAIGTLFYALVYNSWIVDEAMGGAVEPYGLNNGYSTLWLLELYLLGGYFGKYGMPDRLRGGKALWGYLFCALGGWITTMGCFACADGGITVYPYLYGEAYCSPFTVGEAICLLAFFRNVEPGPGASKVIFFVAPSTLCIYMFHYQPLVWNNIVGNLVAAYAQKAVWVVAAAILLYSLAIFVICFGADLVRRWIFDRLKVRQRLAALEEKLIGNLWAPDHT